MCDPSTLTVGGGEGGCVGSKVGDAEGDSVGDSAGGIGVYCTVREDIVQRQNQHDGPHTMVY